MDRLPWTIFLVLSMTLWWYSYEPCEKFIRTEPGHQRLGHENERSTTRTNVYARANELAQHLHVVDLRT